MKRKWKYLLGAFWLAAGLLVGCAEEAGQLPLGIQAVNTDSSEADRESIELEAAETPEIPEAVETPEIPEVTEAPEIPEVVETPEASLEMQLSEEGTYTSKEEVAQYIFLYGHLPDNFITKKEAKALGWVSSEGNLGEVALGKSIGGDYFGNFEGNLPEKEGRDYHECDIDSNGGYRGAKRIVYSNDGLIYYTEDHYQTFELLYGEE